MKPALNVVMMAACAVALAAATRAAKAPAQAAPSTPRPPAMRLDNTFVRGVYWPWERTPWVAKNAGMDVWKFSEKMLRDLKNIYHCDVVWVVNTNTPDSVRLAAIAEKYGIGVMPVVTAIYDWRDVRSAKAAREVAASSVKGLSQSPGIAAYVTIDEPTINEMEQLEEVRRAFAKLDPTRPPLTVSMMRQTESVARRTQMPFLVSDPYSYFGPGSPNGPNNYEASRDYYLISTQKTVQFARETGKRAWMMPQIFSDVWGYWFYDDKMNVVAQPGAHYHWRMPTVGETKWQIWQAIGAGAKGVVFYVLFPTPNPRRSAADSTEVRDWYYVIQPQPDWPLFKTETSLGIGSGIVYNDGSPTVQGRAMGEVFGKLAPHRALLGRLQPTTTAATSDEPFRTTTYRDPQSGKTYVVVVNEQTEKIVTGDVRFFGGVKSVRDVMNRATLSTQANADSGLKTVPLTIEGGEGRILEVEGDVAAVNTYVENFAVQMSGAKTEGVKKELLPMEWGLGYEIGMKKSGDGDAFLEYSVPNVTGDKSRMGGRFYLIYEGTKTGAPGIEAQVSADGKTYRRLSLDEFGKPIALPADATHLRFALLNKDAAFTGWRMISTP